MSVYLSVYLSVCMMIIVLYSFPGLTYAVVWADCMPQTPSSGNTVVMTGASVGGPQCNAPGKTVMGNNSYYTPSGEVR